MPTADPIPLIEQAANQGIALVFAVALLIAFGLLVKYVLKTSNERELRMQETISGACLKMADALKDLNENSLKRHAETQRIIEEEGSKTRKAIYEKRP